MSEDRGILLVNLGTPDAPTPSALRRYLAEFLADPKVVDVQPRWLWWLILHGVILRLRPRRSAHAYAKIWTAEGSPLRVESEALAAAVADRVQQEPGMAGVRLALAMRYGKPRIVDVMQTMRAAGVRRLLVLPLYPQYAGASTGTALDAVAKAAAAMTDPLELRCVEQYHDDPRWLDAVATSVRTYWQANGRGDRLLMSFHGIPVSQVAAGDPYFEQCTATAEALRARLGLDAEQAPLAFQSRVGRQRWIGPYTEETIRALGAAGIRKLDVICPGFAVDCLETLEEIAIRNAEWFREAGGGEMRYIPALNAEPAHVEALVDRVRRELADW